MKAIDPQYVGPHGRTDPDPAALAAAGLAGAGEPADDGPPAAG